MPAGEPQPLTLSSVGHGARSIEDLLGILRGAGIELLVDVRSRPGSRRHPQFGEAALRDSLDLAGIAYEWRPDLGGFRTPRPNSPHTALANDTLRGYADHMGTEEFEHGLAWLLRAGAERRTAFMCAESEWTACHRRLLSDAATARGGSVVHLRGADAAEPHRLHPAARVEDGCVIYDGPQPEQGTLVG